MTWRRRRRAVATAIAVDIDIAVATAIAVDIAIAIATRWRACCAGVPRRCLALAVLFVFLMIFFCGDVADR